MLARRTMMQGGMALAAFMFAGCAEAGKKQVAKPKVMTIYRDPGCGCCLAWAALARRAGYETSVIDSSDMAVLKRRLGVPSNLSSCHTGLIEGYVIEGHVPFDRISTLLARRSDGIRGLAVPGMPAGSPGMEAPDGRSERFEVLAFDSAGRSSGFR